MALNQATLADLVRDDVKSWRGGGVRNHVLQHFNAVELSYEEDSDFARLELLCWHDGQLELVVVRYDLADNFVVDAY